MNKILIIAPSWIGDMVMAQTLFRLIKLRDQSAIIHVLAPAFTLPLVKLMPEVDLAIESPFGHGQLRLFERYRLARNLKKEKYTQAIVLPNSLKSALIPLFARIPKRTGFRGEMRYGLLNDVRILDRQKLPQLIQRFAALALPANQALPKDLPWPKIPIERLPQNLRNSLKNKGKFNKEEITKHTPERQRTKILALCPGAEYGPSKKWPEKYFAEVANNKLQDNWQVWLFGGKNDAAVGDNIQKLTENRCINYTGQTSLIEAVALLSLADLVITNDSGLMHIAAALEKPIIAIYGSTSPEFTPPLSDHARILKSNLPCSPCFERTCRYEHYRCLADITPQMVLDIIQQN